MILNKYTIFDSALEAYHQDYSLENDAIALRQFADMANEETQNRKKSRGLQPMAYRHIRNNNWGVNPYRTCLPCQSTRARVTIQT